VQFSDLFPFTPEVGYLGLSVISFFGSLIPFVPLPSFLLLATMAVGDKFDIHALALISAITSKISCSPFIPASKKNGMQIKKYLPNWSAPTISEYAITEQITTTNADNLYGLSLCFNLNVVHKNPILNGIKAVNNIVMALG